MIYKTYRSFLYWLSLALCTASLCAVFWTAVRIYPAFGFLGVLSSEDKLGLLKETSVYITVATVCVLIVASESKRLSRRTLMLAVVCALLPPFGIILFTFQSANRSSYQIAALCFFIIPLTLTSAMSDFIPIKIRSKISYCHKISAFLGALLLLINSLSTLYLITGSVMLLPVILYTMIPFVILINIIIFLNRFMLLLSTRTIILLYIYAAVLPVCVILLPYNTENIIFAGGCLLIIVTVVLLISTIYDIGRIYYGKHKQKS